MQTKKYKLIELFFIFVLVPICWVLPIFSWIKAGIGIFGFIYIIYILLKVERNTFKMASNINWKQFWKHTFFKLIFIIIITTLYMWFVDKENLFIVVLNKPLKWLIFLFIYTFLSVYPQELIFRTFFFQRYRKLIHNESLFIFINAILFSLAHIFFRSALVMCLTFLGGLLFAFTYNKTKSTLLVSIEHAVYGCWLFTVGMGSMLGFPS